MEKIIILSHKSCFPSARLLKTKLLEAGIKTLLMGSLQGKSTKLLKNATVFRYGNSEPVSSRTIGNSGEFIHLTSSKLRFTNLLQEKGIPSPVFSQAVPEEFPILIRTSLNLCGGKGIIPCKNPEEFKENWRNSYFWTKYIPNKWELRIHVLGNKIVKIMKKVPIEGVEEGELPIRNQDRGYHFQIRIVEKYPKLSEHLKNVLQVLNDAGGFAFSLDLAWTGDGYFIFEANSGSGLNDRSAELYTKYIKGVLETGNNLFEVFPESSEEEETE